MKKNRTKEVINENDLFVPTPHRLDVIFRLSKYNKHTSASIQTINFYFFRNKIFCFFRFMNLLYIKIDNLLTSCIDIF